MSTAKERSAAAAAETVRVRRLRDDARRPISVNLAEGIALSHQLMRFTGVARGRAAIVGNEYDRQPFVGCALDLLAGRCRVGLDEGRSIRMGRAALDREVNRFIHEFGGGARPLSMLIAFPSFDLPPSRRAEGQAPGAIVRKPASRAAAAWRSS